MPIRRAVKEVFIDSILWAIGVLLRLPFYLLGLAIFVVIWLPLSLLAGLWHFVLAPVLWVITIPFRLFNLPRHGAGKKLSENLHRDVVAWNYNTAKWFRTSSENLGELNGFLLRRGS